MVVFKILTRTCQHGWKEHLKICKAARFDSEFLETNKDIPLQSHENLQTLVWWGARCSPYTHTHTTTTTTIRTNAACKESSVR